MTQQRHEQKWSVTMTNGERMRQMEMAQNSRGTACHPGGTPCHESRNPLKNNKKKGWGTKTPCNAEKVFVYKAFEATGSLLRQVCCFLSGMGSIEMQARSPHPLADGCGCDVRPSRFCIRPGTWSVNRLLPEAPTKTPADRITILVRLLLSLVVVAPAPAWPTHGRLHRCQPGSQDRLLVRREIGTRLR